MGRRKLIFAVANSFKFLLLNDRVYVWLGELTDYQAKTKRRESRLKIREKRGEFVRSVKHLRRKRGSAKSKLHHELLYGRNV